MEHNTVICYCDFEGSIYVKAKSLWYQLLFTPHSSSPKVQYVAVYLILWTAAVSPFQVCAII